MFSLLENWEAHLLANNGWPSWSTRTIAALILCIGVINLIELLRYFFFAKNKKDEVESHYPSTSFRWFQLQYLSVYLVVMLADWLQGPNMYSLYTSYGVDAGTLFLTGFASSAVFGTFLGIYIDRWGRKLGCVIFCVLEIVINLLEHVPSMPVLIVGRVLGGISTSLLFSSFESWMVSHHRKQRFPEAWLTSTFAIASWGSGLMGFTAGLVGQMATDVAGDIGPFQLAVALTCVALVMVFTWTENYGSDAVESVSGSGEDTTTTESSKTSSDSASIMQSLIASTRLALSEPRMALLGLSQAVFEGGVFTFVFMWYKVLHLTLGGKVPAGLVMTAFMLAMAIGGMISSILLDIFPGGATGMCVATYVLAAAAMSVPVLSFRFEHVFAAFLVLEVTVGMFNSCGATLRSRFYPEKQHSSIMNVFRIPLNLLVVLGTNLSDWAADEAALRRVFCVIVCMHLIATAMQVWLAWLDTDASKAKKERVAEASFATKKKL